MAHGPAGYVSPVDTATITTPCISLTMWRDFRLPAARGILGAADPTQRKERGFAMDLVDWLVTGVAAWIVTLIALGASATVPERPRRSRPVGSLAEARARRAWIRAPRCSDCKAMVKHWHRLPSPVPYRMAELPPEVA